jgi:hypothetical protein
MVSFYENFFLLSVFFFSQLQTKVFSIDLAGLDLLLSRDADARAGFQGLLNERLVLEHSY